MPDNEYITDIVRSLASAINHHRWRHAYEFCESLRDLEKRGAQLPKGRTGAQLVGMKFYNEWKERYSQND